MSATTTKVTAAVSGHWLLGTLRLAEVRIQETLNDPRTDFLQLYDVEVRGLPAPECLASLSKLLVAKSKIEFIIVPSSSHEAPEKRRNNRVAKAAVPAFAIVSDYYIRGRLHLAGTSGDFRYTLLHELGTFFALTDASVGHRASGASLLQVPLVLANKELVSCIDVGGPATVENSNAVAARPVSYCGP